MTDFGSILRRLRFAKNWRQQDLVEALDGRIARSTIANIEAGRQPPTPRLWALLEEHVPHWKGALEPSYMDARRCSPTSASHRHGVLADSSPAQPGRPTLAGPFVIESLQLVYVFRHSRSPEEILEIRRVRATRAGADGYGLKFIQTKHEGFRADEEPLWGGHLANVEHHDVSGKTLYVRRMNFDRTLRKGQVHEFAVRSWIERDPQPDTSVSVNFTIPCKSLAIHLNFHGPQAPTDCWGFGPIADEALTPTDPGRGAALPITPGGTVSRYLTGMEPGAEYGIAWRWPDQPRPA
jgi:hypothetical protein